MRAEAVIHALLAADATVLTLLGSNPIRLYPSRLPQNTTMPAAAYQAISGTELTPIDAQAGRQVVRTRVQFNAMAKTYAEVKALIEAARLACLYKSGFIATGVAAIGTVQVLSILRDNVGPDQRDDDLGLYMQSIDFMVMHYET